MKQNKFIKAMALMLSLTMITSVFVGNTLSRYVTSVSSTDSARVAIWGINGEEVTMELFNTSYDLSGKKIAEANLNDDGVTRDKIIAPGTGGQSKFSIINYMNTVIPPEVAYEVKIILDDSQVDPKIFNNASIQWKLDDNEWGTWNELKTSLLSLSGDSSGIYTYAPGEFAEKFKDNVEHIIYWQWTMDGDNKEDTQIGNDTLINDISAKISVQIIAEQSDGSSVNMLNGANQVINVNDIQPAIFRSAAPKEDLQEVKVNNEVVDPENYTVTEGSTIITFKKSFLETLNKGSYTLEIISKNMTASAKFYVADAPIVHNGIIPEGGTYYVNATANAIAYTPSSSDATGLGDYSLATITYIAGQKFPKPQLGDVYVYGDFEYRYGFEFMNNWKWFKTEGDVDGWSVRLLDKEKSAPGVILTTIAGLDVTNFNCAFSMSKIVDVPTIPETAKKMVLAFYSCNKLIVTPAIPKSVTSWEKMFYSCGLLKEVSNIPDTVVDLVNTFVDCHSLEIVPTIPDSVIDMSGAFYNCRSLKTIPNFPNKLKNLNTAFYNCDSLKTIPTIPNSVTDITWAFENCINLTGTVEINTNNLISYSTAFKGTKVTWITGSISDEMKQKIVDNSGLTLIDPSTISSILSENDWETISKVTKFGQAGDYWKVGDKTTVDINGTDYEVVIIDIEHDDYEDNITFVFTESVATTVMNAASDGYPYGDNIGSWKESEIRKSILPEILNQMENKDYIKQTYRKTIKGYADGNVDDSIYTLIGTSDKLFLLSYTEVFGNQYASAWDDFNEGTQYEYFKNSENRIIKSSEDNDGTEWWLRTPSVSFENAFYGVDQDGNYSNCSAHHIYSVVPAFVIG